MQVILAKDKRSNLVPEMELGNTLRQPPDYASIERLLAHEHKPVDSLGRVPRGNVHIRQPAGRETLNFTYYPGQAVVRDRGPQHGNNASLIAGASPGVFGHLAPREGVPLHAAPRARYIGVRQQGDKDLAAAYRGKQLGRPTGAGGHRPVDEARVRTSGPPDQLSDVLRQVLKELHDTLVRLVAVHGMRMAEKEQRRPRTDLVGRARHTSRHADSRRTEPACLRHPTGWKPFCHDIALARSRQCTVAYAR